MIVQIRPFDEKFEINQEVELVDKEDPKSLSKQIAMKQQVIEELQYKNNK